MTTPTNHDASKVAMGAMGSSDRVVSNFPSDPASFPAGHAVRLKSDGTLSTVSTDGALVGVSLGRSLSDHKKTSVVRSGNKVPLLMAPYLTVADLTFVSKVGTPVSIELVAGGTAGTAGSEVVTVTDGLISVSMEDGVSTATQIKAALDAEADALALIETVITGTAGDAQDAFAEDAIDTLDHAVLGAVVRVSNATGKAVPTGIGSATGAVYVSGLKTGVKLDGTTVSAAVIDMGGGL